MKPITPEEVVAAKKSQLPDFVIEIFNKLIAKTFSNGMASFQQEDVIQLLLAHMEPKDRQAIFNNRWLDVEGIYREAGWKVEYDKPGYNESYPATFTFKVTSHA